MTKLEQLSAYLPMDSEENILPQDKLKKIGMNLKKLIDKIAQLRKELKK